MLTERHACNRTKAVPPKAGHHPCSATAGFAVAAAALGAAAALFSAGAAASGAAPRAASAECAATATSAAEGGVTVAEGAGGQGACVPWGVEGPAEGGVGWGMPGAAELACWHVPTCGKRRRGAVEEGRDNRCAVSVRELFHMRLTGGCNSAVGRKAEPRLSQRFVASHRCVPHRTAHEEVGAPGFRRMNSSICRRHAPRLPSS